MATDFNLLRRRLETERENLLEELKITVPLHRLIDKFGLGGG